VVYADIDPVAIAHSRAILARHENATIIEGDLREPQKILGHEAVARLIDPAQPAAPAMIAPNYLSEAPDLKLLAGGGDASAIRTNRAREDDVERMIATTLTHFGRIDALVNNAAITFPGDLDMELKRFDLVMGVNARAAFLCCRAVLPTMIQRRSGHIINMSPPLDLSMVPGRIAYSISKLGMTLLSLGLAEEVRTHNIAVNSLWPVTIIETQASINHALGKPAMWRKPDILVDCVLHLAQKEPAEITGQALLDEDFLRAEGVTDFSGYACVPGTQPPRVSWSMLRPR